METKRPRPIYLIFRLAGTLLSVFSRFLNATFFGGSTYQSLSARAFIETTTSPVWARRRRILDKTFYLLLRQEDHCRKYWEAEVDAALKTLRRAGVGTNP